MLKLKLQYTGPPDEKNWLIGKDPDTGKEWGHGEKVVTENEMLDSIIDSMDMSLSKYWEIVKDKEVWHAIVHGSQRVRLDWATEQQQQNQAWYNSTLLVFA